jgi:hypothetical protein
MNCGQLCVNHLPFFGNKHQKRHLLMKKFFTQKLIVHSLSRFVGTKLFCLTLLAHVLTSPLSTLHGQAAKTLPQTGLNAAKGVMQSDGRTPLNSSTFKSAPLHRRHSVRRNLLKTSVNTTNLCQKVWGKPCLGWII